MLETFRRWNPETHAAISEEKRVRRTTEVFILFSLGSQFDHLIKQHLERLGVYCLVADPATVTVDDVQALNPIGIILSGGPASVHSEPPSFDTQIFDIGIPVLGICLGFQLWAQHIGIEVKPAIKREFGQHRAYNLEISSPLFVGCGLRETLVLESHGDSIAFDDTKLEILAQTENALVAAAQHRHLWGVQFHPEVTETIEGVKMLSNFCFSICGAKDRFPAEEIAQRKIAELREQIREKRVLIALSGGADSSTVACLLKEAADNTQIRGIYISGIDRPDDQAHVEMFFGIVTWMELCVVDGAELFLEAVKGKTSMKEKRLAMKDVYREILEREIRSFQADFIVQGTLYTDLSESGKGYETGARKAVIKVHHNTDNHFSVPELTPLADCVKDGGRNIGESIHVPRELLYRHPFPGPGLLLRIEGAVDQRQLQIAREVDGIYIEELRNWNLYDSVWQAGAVITASRTTCTKGDDAAEGIVVALWAVWSVNGFTARVAELPWDFLHHVSQRITNEVKEVGSVVYRTTGKPPATIEWG